MRILIRNHYVVEIKARRIGESKCNKSATQAVLTHLANALYEAAELMEGKGFKATSDSYCEEAFLMTRPGPSEAAVAKAEEMERWVHEVLAEVH